MRLTHGILALVGFLLASVLVPAQSTRAINGVVTDQDSHKLQGAVVQLEDTTTLVVRSFITQTDGNFHFVRVETDRDYEVKAIYDGVPSNTHRVSRFDGAKAIQIKLTVRLGK